MARRRTSAIGWLRSRAEQGVEHTRDGPSKFNSRHHMIPFRLPQQDRKSLNTPSTSLLESTTRSRPLIGKNPYLQRGKSTTPTYTHRSALKAWLTLKLVSICT